MDELQGNDPGISMINDYTFLAVHPNNSAGNTLKFEHYYWKRIDDG
ncbi:hypothetical protein ACFPVT_05895 [Corynebacterium choanae]|nr:hypothetical protein [Corynebacterium choanae]